MMDIQIEVTGDTRVLAYLAELKRRTPEVTDETGKEACSEMAKIARTKVAPGKTGSGALRKAINYKRTAGSKSSAMKVWTVDTSGTGRLKGAPIPQDQRPFHAYYQEYGFAPHQVRVSNLSPGSLKERMQDLGVQVITVKTWTPYMNYARNQVLKRIRTITNRHVKAMIMSGR
jgi:hypothetical protein